MGEALSKKGRQSTKKKKKGNLIDRGKEGELLPAIGRKEGFSQKASSTFCLGREKSNPKGKRKRWRILSQKRERKFAPWEGSQQVERIWLEEKNNPRGEKRGGGSACFLTGTNKGYDRVGETFGSIPEMNRRGNSGEGKENQLETKVQNMLSKKNFKSGGRKGGTSSSRAVGRETGKEKGEGD